MGLFFGEFNMDTALEVAREESYDKGIKKGMERGREEGKTEGILTTAKNFLSLGIPIEDVIKATGLPRAELESL